MLVLDLAAAPLGDDLHRPVLKLMVLLPEQPVDAADCVPEGAGAHGDEEENVEEGVCEELDNRWVVEDEVDGHRHDAKGEDQHEDVVHSGCDEEVVELPPLALDLSLLNSLPQNCLRIVRL